MKILAFIPLFNEEDIIYSTINYLINQGIYIYILDNWSTDSSIDIIKSFSSNHIINIEKNPNKIRKEIQWDLEATSDKICKLSKKLDFDWFLWHDADEYFQGIWKGQNLKESIMTVENGNYNAISFNLLSFYPIDNNFLHSGEDFFNYFKYYSPIYCIPNCRWVRAWKKQPKIFFHGGSHEVIFPDRKIYPKKFIIRHFPIRSQSHGVKKVFKERIPRYSENGKEKGWHIQYKNINKDFCFLKNKSDLREYYDNDFKIE